MGIRKRRKTIPPQQSGEFELSPEAPSTENGAAGGDQRLFRAQGLLGRSRAMREAYRQIREGAGTDIPVLISGETGTGKDLAARALHAISGRHEGPYVPIHLGALPPPLVASELFGHEAGAFTGALGRRIGKFEEANHGTIFLDEISTVDAQVQVSLLQVLESKCLTRLGGQRSIATDVRVVAATNENLADLVECGQFRQDLMYRLDVLHVRMPALRERHGDIPLLVRAFLDHYRKSFGRRVRAVAPGCVATLQAYPWPGNVRELKNVMQRAVLLCREDILTVEHLPPRFQETQEVSEWLRFRVGTPLCDVERELIARTVATARNRTHAAQLLGISRRALYNKLERYKLL